MPKTEYACPLCSTPSQISAGSGSLSCERNPEHRWVDSLEFLKLEPQKTFKVAAQVFPAQVGHVKFSLLVEPNVEAKLRAKFGEKVDATVSGVLQMMAEGSVIVVPETDCERIRKLLNQKPESSAELFGILFALDQQATDAKNEKNLAEAKLEAYERRVPGMVVIDISRIEEAVKDKAQSAEMPVKEYIESNLKNAIDNNWF